MHVATRRDKMVAGETQGAVPMTLSAEGPEAWCLAPTVGWRAPEAAQPEQLSCLSVLLLQACAGYCPSGAGVGMVDEMSIISMFLKSPESKSRSLLVDTGASACLPLWWSNFSSTFLCYKVKMLLSLHVIIRLSAPFFYSKGQWLLSCKYHFGFTKEKSFFLFKHFG